MSLSRLLFVREAVWLIRFAGSLVLFAGMWIRSRRYLRLLAALPALALATAFGWAVFQSYLDRRDPALRENILTQARSAFVDGQIKQARLLFRRAEQLAPGNRELTMEFAESLFRQGERPEAYQMLASIAPVRKTGYLPAHRFLAQNPPDGSAVQRDYFRAIHLSHLVRGSSETRDERTQLLGLLAKYRRFDDAEQLIRSALDRYPEDRLFLAQLKVRANDQVGARRTTEEARDALQSLVAENPRRIDRRLQLAQGYVFLGQFADAICCLSDGLNRNPNLPPNLPSMEANAANQETSSNEKDKPLDHEQQLTKTLVRTYFAWMSKLPFPEQVTQQRCLLRMLQEDQTVLVEGESSESLLNLQDKLTSALLDPKHLWIRDAIRGNAEASLGRLKEAETLYRRALSSSPTDPTLNNNLAWVLFTQAQSSLVPVDHSVRSRMLNEASSMSQQAVETMPDIASFLETRGQIHAALGRYQEAAQDLLACQKLGKDSIEIRRTLDSISRHVSRIRGK